ncbi:MAG: hypothetical protein ACLQVM_10975 [Terriglobia bacterium]
MLEAEEVGLDWRFEVPRVAVRITLRELKRFHDDGEKRFNAEFAKLEARAREVAPEDYDQNDYLSDLRDQLEGTMELVREFAIVGISRTLERFWRIFLNPARYPGLVIPPRKGDRLDDIRKQYKSIGIDLTKPPFEWHEIRKLQAVRNCIVHDEGWADGKRATALRGYQFKVKNGLIELPPDYFLEAYKIVDKTCGLVVDKCREAAKTGKIARRT